MAIQKSIRSFWVVRVWFPFFQKCTADLLIFYTSFIKSIKHTLILKSSTYSQYVSNEIVSDYQQGNVLFKPIYSITIIFIYFLCLFLLSIHYYIQIIIFIYSFVWGGFRKFFILIFSPTCTWNLLYDLLTNLDWTAIKISVICYQN